jgi:hypothetical protein
MESTAEDRLRKAAATLFGPGAGEDHRFLLTLPLPALKSAYRKKALSLHPDMRLRRGRGGDEQCSARFIEARQAYEEILSFLGKRGIEAAAAGRKAPVLPGRRLYLGEYLARVGAVPEGAVARALTWQRGLRPPLGELARRRGWLSERALHRAMEGRQRGEPLGRAVLRMGYLTHQQVRSLLFCQMRAQRPLGAYFVTRAYLTPEELETHLSGCRAHNARFPEGVLGA